MKKRSSLSKKMVGVLATALSVTPSVAVHAESAGVETPPINYFIEKDGPAETIHLPSLFSGATSFNDYNVSGAVYGHSTYIIDGNNDLIITPRTTVPLSENHDSNIDTIGFGVDGVEHTFNVQVVSKPKQVQLPDLTMIHNHTATIDLADYFSDEDDNRNLSYFISGSLMSGSYTSVSGTELSIYVGSQAFTTAISVTAYDSDSNSPNNLAGHSITNMFQLTVAANRLPVVGTAFEGSTIDVEVNNTGLLIPKSELFTDADGDTLNYTFSGNYGCALNVVNLSCSNEIEIDAKQLGTYNVTVGVNDQHDGIKALNFTVNVHPKLSFNSTGTPLYLNGTPASVKSSTEGTVYLVPTTETISFTDQLDSLVNDHKATKILVTNVATDYPLQTTDLPMGTYRLYLLVGNSFYSPITSNAIYVTSSDFLSGLASTEGKIDVSSILKFLNGSSVAPLKELGLIDRNVIHSLLDLITPIVVPDSSVNN